MTKITAEEVKKLASLAKLQLTNDQIDAFRSEMESIMGLIDQLQAADVDEYEPTEQVTGLTNVARPDEVTQQAAEAADLVALAKDSQNNQYKVKRVLG